MDHVRIAFCGASGTGKTKLAEWVEAELGLPFNPVGSRSVAKAMGFDNPYDVDAAGKRAEFQRRLVTDKRGWEDEHESFVSDRTTLDNLVYTMFHDIYAIDRELMGAIVEGLKRYTHIVFFPVDVFCRIADDPHRVGGGKYDADMTYHQLYDTTLRALLVKHRPPTALGRSGFHVMDTADFDSRTRWLQEILGR